MIKKAILFTTIILMSSTNCIHSTVKLNTANNKIPTKVRLFKAGANKTSKGTFYYNPKLKAEILARQTEQDGRDLLPIDVSHNSLRNTDDPDAGISVGWFKLVLDDLGIWATEIQWTKRGEQYLLNREYRFISPAFLVNNKKEIVQIINFAVTNEPATYNPLPLVASKINKDSNMSNKQEDEVVKEEATKEENLVEEEVTEQLEDENKEPVKLEEEGDEQPEDLPGEEDKDEKDEMIEKLEAQIASLQEQLKEALEKLGAKDEELEGLQKSVEQFELEKEEITSEFIEYKKEIQLSKLSITAEEKEIYKALDLEAVTKLVELRKSDKSSDKLSSEDKEILANKVPANKKEKAEEEVVFNSIPSIEEIRARLAK